MPLYCHLTLLEKKKKKDNKATSSHCLPFFGFYHTVKVAGEKYRKKLGMLLSQALFCSPHHRPMNQETSCWDKNNHFIQKASWPTGEQTNVLENHLPPVKLRFLFYWKGSGSGWLVHTFSCRNPLLLELSQGS